MIPLHYARERERKAVWVTVTLTLAAADFAGAYARPTAECVAEVVVVECQNPAAMSFRLACVVSRGDMATAKRALSITAIHVGRSAIITLVAELPQH